MPDAPARDRAVDVVAAAIDESISEFVRLRESEHGFEADPSAAAGVAVDTLLAAPAVLRDLARSALGVTAEPGMVVDGDLLRDVIADAVPRYIADDTARHIADAALDGAHRAGMTLLHGPDSTPRPRPAAGEQAASPSVLPAAADLAATPDEPTPTCSTCEQPIDVTQPHVVTVRQVEHHTRPGVIDVDQARLLTARHGTCAPSHRPDPGEPLYRLIADLRGAAAMDDLGPWLEIPRHRLVRLLDEAERAVAVAALWADRVRTTEQAHHRRHLMVGASLAAALDQLPTQET